MFRYIISICGLFFNLTILGSLASFVLFSVLFSYYSKDLPSAEQIENYKPPTLSRVYDRDGNVLGIFGSKNRIYTPIEDIPDLVKNSFISAEDKNFYDHPGYDAIGVLKAVIDAFRGKKLRGASTITQQIMKNFLLSGERTVKRKIKEIILASRIERVLSKNKILNVYLNEVYLGQGAYGVTAASIIYFGKKLNDLNIGEAAFLAALPKAPSFYHPIRRKQRSIERRNFVIKELKENGFISLSEATLYSGSELTTVLSHTQKNTGLSLKRFYSYFNDEIKRSILINYSEKALKTDGLSIRATVNSELQALATQALQSELINFDQHLGIYRGPISQIPEDQLRSVDSIDSSFEKLNLRIPVSDWSLAIVIGIFDNYAKILVKDNSDELVLSKLYLQDCAWIKKRSAMNKKTFNIKETKDIWSIGDVIYVENKTDLKEQRKFWRLRQVPEVQGAFMVMEPNSGKVLAMQGGFSYKYSKFNRASQAMRQPGSLFKPFVYLAALENGFHPNSIIVDAPISIKGVRSVWKPKNSSFSWFGVAPLRKGLEYSRNLMTVRLAKEISMLEVAKYAKIFGLYDKMPLFLSYALGSGETTLLKLMTAYSILANGGLEVKPSFFDLVQNRYGSTIYRHGYLKCTDCEVIDPKNIVSPKFVNMARRLVDPVSIYQINSMLKGVVTRGTASKTVGKVGLDVAGKTGTTNDSKDVWFIGYSPDVVAGCYIGYDIPRSLGNTASGGSLCGSAFANFIKNAYGDTLKSKWQIPVDTKFVDINYDTGEVSNNKGSKHKIVRELFRKSKDPSQPNMSYAVDGGLGMGQDFLNSNEPDNIDGNLLLRKSLGAFTTGDLY